MNNNKLNPNQILQITNTLRLLGLNSSHIGTKLLNKSIQFIIANNLEFFTLEEIYSYLHSIYDFNINTIKSNMNKSIYNRNIEISKNNFQKLFNYDYDEYFFSAKNLISEISNIINFRIEK